MEATDDEELAPICTILHLEAEELISDMSFHRVISIQLDAVRNRTGAVSIFIE